MYICYVDESGHCGRKRNPRQPVEVLCGVLTDITKLAKTQREHSALLRDLGLGELKSAEAYRGRKEWGSVKPAERDALFEKVMGWADERKSKFVVCPIDSDRFFRDKEAGGAFSDLLQYPYEAGALNILLALERHQKTKRSNKGKTIVIFDEQQEHDQSLLKILAGDLSFTDDYTGFVPKPRRKNPPARLEQIIDVPHFSKSHLSVLIQIADLVAFIVNHYLKLAKYGVAESYEGELEKLTRWYRLVGDNRIRHTATDPPGGGISQYFRESMRPPGWSAREWL